MTEEGLGAVRLRWERSWSRRPSDFTGSHASTTDRTARIYKDDRQKGQRAWRWAVLDEHHHLAEGYAPDAAAAAHAAEQAFFNVGALHPEDQRVTNDIDA